ncbi:MAG: sensor histidine kinase [Pyrinomonadaceae bacterium MAG19_C2-C3]|nr:sensor histidine kinase [Pyrinomonadaceae bacterium MAG19_C2-C3]
MNLKRKLLTVFGALALLSLLTAGMTLWMIGQWRATNQRIENHYQRSLLLQRVRATMFRSFKEVPDAVTGDDLDSREEFNEYIKPAEDDFAQWSKLAETNEELEQVKQVRAAYDALVAVANQTFDLVEAGRMREAFELMEGKLEDDDLATFQRLTEQAAESDRSYREQVRASVDGTRRTAQIVLSIAAFATVSLVLLLAAYLASDLFKPLKEVEQALKRAGSGDWKTRLTEERADEFGAINKAFNRMAESVAQREQRAGMGVTDADSDPTSDGTWHNTTSRLTLHTLVAQLRARVLRLADNGESNGNANANTADDERRKLVEKVEQLSQAVVRVTEFGFPLDLNLARTDIRELLYETLLRFHEELTSRGISFEIDIAPEVSFAIVDRLKLREAIGELVRNALRALPERGGRIGLRSRVEADEELIIEVADNGAGSDDSLIDNTFSREKISASTIKGGVGLRLIKAIAEQHGGKLSITSERGTGTFVQLKLPVRE